jgi:hypothetical protein
MAPLLLAAAARSCQVASRYKSVEGAAGASIDFPPRLLDARFRRYWPLLGK